MDKIKVLFLRLITPIQKIMQRLGRSEPLMNRKAVDLIISQAKAGDILLSYESQRFTSLFIKGTYKHAAIISPKMTVIESVGSGVREVDLEEWLFEKDYVALIRPEYSSETNYLASCNSLSYLGSGYDYEFSLNNNKIYCSELIYLCYLKEVESFLSEYSKHEILPELYRDLCDVSKSVLKLIYEFKGTI